MGVDLLCLAGALSPDATQCKQGLSAALTNKMLDAAEVSVDISLKLIGVMALWLGLLRVAEKAGLIELVGRVVEPLMVRLFPEIPKGHPSISAMTLNLS